MKKDNQIRAHSRGFAVSSGLPVFLRLFCRFLVFPRLTLCVLLSSEFQGFGFGWGFTALRKSAAIVLLAACCSVFLSLRGGSLSAQQTPSGDPSAQANQQKARALLNQMIQTLGGQAYLNLQTSESDGRYGRFYRERSEGSTPFHRYWEWPEKERIELTKQRDVVELISGDQMWEITFRGSRIIDPKKDYDAQVYIERQHRALDVILRQWLNQPGIALFDEGPALAENHSVERISIITANNDAVSLSIDTDSHVPVKKTFVIRDLQGYRDEVGEVYDNWKMIQGVNTPFNMLVTRNGEVSRQYFLESITYNAPLKSELFEPGKLFNLKKK